MSKTIELTREEVFEAMEDGKNISSGNWKYGALETYLFDRDGAKYIIDVMYHHSEGIYIEGKTLTATKVKPVEKTIIEWVEDNE